MRCYSVTHEGVWSAGIRRRLCLWKTGFKAIRTRVGQDRSRAVTEMTTGFYPPGACVFSLNRPACMLPLSLCDSLNGQLKKPLSARSLAGAMHQGLALVQLFPCSRQRVALIAKSAAKRLTALYQFNNFIVKQFFINGFCNMIVHANLFALQ